MRPAEIDPPGYKGIGRLSPEDDRRRQKELEKKLATKRGELPPSRCELPPGRLESRVPLPQSGDRVPDEMLGQRSHFETPEYNPHDGKATGRSADATRGRGPGKYPRGTPGRARGGKRALVESAAAAVTAKGLTTTLDNITAELGDRWTESRFALASIVYQLRHQGRVAPLPEGLRGRGRPIARSKPEPESAPKPGGAPPEPDESALRALASLVTAFRAVEPFVRMAEGVLGRVGETRP